MNENDVVDMNRRLGGDVSLNTLVHADEAGEAKGAAAEATNPGLSGKLF